MRFKRFGKRGFAEWVWEVIIVLVITIVAAILFFFIFKERIGGLLHL